MNIFQKAWRAIAQNAVTRIDEPPPMTGFGGFQQHPDIALKEATVYRCVGVIASHVVQMPLEIRRGFDLVDDPVLTVLNDRANFRWNAPEFWEYMVGSVLLRGDGFARIARNGRGFPTALIPYHPDWVDIQRDRESRLLFYRMTDPHGQPEDNGVFSQRDVLHFKGLGWSPNSFGDNFKSPSVLSAALNAVGYKKAMDDYARAFYDGGLQQQFVIKSKQKATSKEQLKQIKQFVQSNYGGAQNSKMPLIIGGDDDVKPLTIAPRDAQILELQEFRAVEIAKAFGVPNVMLNLDPKVGAVAKATTELIRFFVRTTVVPLTNRMRAELQTKLPLRGRIQFNPDGLLAANPSERFAAWTSALGGQPFMTVNEIRRLEGLAPIEGEEWDVPPLMPGTAQNEEPEPQDEEELRQEIQDELA